MRGNSIQGSAELLAELRRTQDRLLGAADRSEPVWEATLCLYESLMHLLESETVHASGDDQALRLARLRQARNAVRAASLAIRFASAEARTSPPREPWSRYASAGGG